MYKHDLCWERTNRVLPQLRFSTSCGVCECVVHTVCIVSVCDVQTDGQHRLAALALLYSCLLSSSANTPLWRFRWSFPSALVPLSHIPHSRSHVWANAARSAANGQLEDITQHARCLLAVVGEETTTTAELLKKLTAGFKLRCSDLVTLTLSASSSFLPSDCFCLLLFASRLHS